MNNSRLRYRANGQTGKHTPRNFFGRDINVMSKKVEGLLLTSR